MAKPHELETMIKSRNNYKLIHCTTKKNLGYACACLTDDVGWYKLDT